MHYTEKSFLHLPGILGAKDDHFPPSQVKVYASRRCHVVCVTITRKLPSIVYSEVRSTKILQLFGCRSNTHVVHKQRMVSSSRYNPDFNSVLWIPIQELVVHKYLIQRIQIINSSFSVDHEGMFIHLNVW
uniref:Uncharacterized protein n=1 Tax=Opuntia streptacantha TaxID=393608 RepID=A0A7C8ZKK5_OPUST